MHFIYPGTKTLETTAAKLRALAHPLRISILNYIESNQPVKVRHIHSDLSLDQSITSQHLRILRDADLVRTRREGKFIFYLVNRDFIVYAIEQIIDFDNKTLAHRKKKR